MNSRKVNVMSYVVKEMERIINAKVIASARVDGYNVELSFFEILNFKVKLYVDSRVIDELSPDHVVEKCVNDAKSEFIKLFFREGEL